LAQYRELQAFAQFASDLDEATRKQIERGQRVTELMKQVQYSPYSVAQLALSLFSANKGFLDDVDPAKIVDFEKAMQDYIQANNSDLIDKINESGDYDSEIEQGMSDAITAFKSNSSW